MLLDSNISVTRNVADFEGIPGLRILNPFATAGHDE